MKVWTRAARFCIILTGHAIVEIESHSFRLISVASEQNEIEVIRKDNDYNKKNYNNDK